MGRSSTPAAATRCPSRAPRKTGSTTCTRCCGAAAIPGPYVLVGHSAGGLVARLYASEYPDEVVGHGAAGLHPRGCLAAFPGGPDAGRNGRSSKRSPSPTRSCSMPIRRRSGGTPPRWRTTPPPARYARRARMRPCTRCRWSCWPTASRSAHPFPGWPSDKMEAIMFALQQDLASLVPNARFDRRHRERAQHPPGPAGAGDRRHPAGGRGRTRPARMGRVAWWVTRSGRSTPCSPAPILERHRAADRADRKFGRLRIPVTGAQPSCRIYTSNELAPVQPWVRRAERDRHASGADHVVLDADHQLGRAVLRILGHVGADL